MLHRVNVRRCWITWNADLRPTLGTNINPLDNIVYKASIDSEQQQLGVIQSIERRDECDLLHFNLLQFHLCTTTDEKMNQSNRDLYELDDSKSIGIQSNQIINIARMFEYTIDGDKYYIAHPLGATTLPLLYPGSLVGKKVKKQ